MQKFVGRSPYEAEDSLRRLRSPIAYQHFPALVADGPEFRIWLLRDPRLNHLDERLQVGLADRPLFFMALSALAGPMLGAKMGVTGASIRAAIYSAAWHRIPWMFAFRSHAQTDRRKLSRGSSLSRRVLTEISPRHSAAFSIAPKIIASEKSNQLIDFTSIFGVLPYLEGVHELRVVDAKFLFCSNPFSRRGGAMGLDQIRAEIALRRLVGRQRKELLQLQRGSTALASAKALLQRLLDKIEHVLRRTRPIEGQTTPAKR
ncbi:hypothetical protein [Bradyrhizobium paxllaeri]|uniref:hypothetical protein n=1 Tax=Bradyrhizobium paxllaeri TaxID=190148 RepID=UPI0011475318|nr:hypothetical protein [Bradyrhizobium paxllaeri]